MNILAIAFVYNEIDYIETAVNYYKEQGCNVYIIDNMSTDGTWEWLQEHKIPSHRFDTKNAFQLEWLQAEMLKTVHMIKPDWFLWFAPDLFHVFVVPIADVLEAAAECGFNQIHSPCYCFKNTGEENHFPLWDTYKYAHLNITVKLISRYHPCASLLGDVITIPAANSIISGVILEYGGCKPVRLQEAKLHRRQKAWKLGTPAGHGCHYTEGKNKNWIHSPAELIDTRLVDEVVDSVIRLKLYLNE